MDVFTREIRRHTAVETHHVDLCVVGGGLSGTCAAITAARAGLSVALIHDRPVLGGNSSSEVRLWALGATSHMNNNNRWAREGGVMDEIYVENTFRNKEGNPILYDTVVLEKATAEPNLTVLLNTAAYDIEKRGEDGVARVFAYNSLNETRYEISAEYFVDASGDGLVAFLAGVPFRFGAEKESEFGEKFAPDPESYGERLGHSIFFYTKDTGEPVEFYPPAYALSDVPHAIPRYRDFSVNDNGCRFWWIEYGGRLDTIHDTEQIKWELWKVIFGVWNHIKNSGDYPEAETMTLEWVGAVPGKRESRRFEGYSMLVQQDIVEQRTHEDDVSFGGWSIDLHPADGVYATRKGCDQYHAKGVYPIPLGTMMSPAATNLLLAGRIISASHVAFGSTRVMATGAHGGQAAAMAVVLAKRLGVEVAELRSGEVARRLQLELVRRGQYIPQLTIADPDDLCATATVAASSTFSLRSGLVTGEARIPLDVPRGQLLPLRPGPIPRIRITVDVAADSAPEPLRVALARSAKPFNFTPELVVATAEVPVAPGAGRELTIDFDGELPHEQYCFLLIEAHPAVSVYGAETAVSGLLSVRRTGRQEPETDIGVEVFDLWTPERRPGGQLLACTVETADDTDRSPFAPENVTSFDHRPVLGPNAWVADPRDPDPRVTVSWDAPQSISQCLVFFDTDFDNAMETVLLGHEVNAVPHCVRHYQLLDDEGRVIHEETDNHSTINRVDWKIPVTTKSVSLRVLSTWGAPAAVFGIHCYETPVV